jgi:hypothetical protein
MINAQAKLRYLRLKDTAGLSDSMVLLLCTLAVPSLTTCATLYGLASQYCRANLSHLGARWPKTGTQGREQIGRGTGQRFTL